MEENAPAALFTHPKNYNTKFFVVLLKRGII
jgi:hypothetical protein